MTPETTETVPEEKAEKTAAKPRARKTAASSKTAGKSTSKTGPKTAAKTGGKSAARAAGSNNLVIVESPAKARTIEKYLGKEFKVLASVGHCIDLPPSKLGVDLDNNFEPEYEIIKGKKKVLDGLKSAADKATAVYLCTDPDREGEAIAWHVANYLKVQDRPLWRATFNEITKTAVQNAIAEAGELNLNLCMAQQSRRILDRLVGYQISPLLWRKVQPGLSAGRVQSVAVRILCEREAEIDAFKPEEYWVIEVDADAQNPPPFKLRLAKIDGEKAKVENAEAARAVVDAVSGQPFIVRAVVKKPVRRNPPPPFITSTLQQEAARKLHFAPAHTMAVAQGLYEGVQLGAEGPVGLITYMRTDSTRVSDAAIAGVRGFIAERYGQDYLPEKPRAYRTGKAAQDAHEAIRPTLLDHPPDKLAQYLNADQMALYKLIWDRFVASQMEAARLEQTTIEVPVREEKYLFTAQGSVLQFPGFLAVYEEGREQDDEEKSTAEETAGHLPAVTEGEHLKTGDPTMEQRFTQPPTRFSMSSLIRELERRGIGRPSTYASILSTILEKKYAERVQGYLRPTELGKILTEILVESFPEILDVKFTAHMEEELDSVEEGQMPWLDVMNEFYKMFKERLDVAQTSMRSPRGEIVETDLDCDKCGAKMVIRWGKNGRFLSCANYPECKNAKPYTVDDDGKVVAEEIPTTEALCPKCGAPMEVKRSKRGFFLACTKYPDCKGALEIAEVNDGVAIAAEALPESDEVCEKCGAPMSVRHGRRGNFLACTKYPKCKNAKDIGEIVDGKAIAAKAPDTGGAKCDKCGADMVVKNGRRGPFLACSAYPKCKNAQPLPEGMEAPAGPEGKTAAKPKATKSEPIITDEKCPNCEKPLALRVGRFGPFLGCTGYPSCKTIVKASPDIIAKYKK